MTSPEASNKRFALWIIAGVAIAAVVTAIVLAMR